MLNNGILESIHGVISTGKEAVILYADGGPGETLSSLFSISFKSYTSEDFC